MRSLIIATKNIGKFDEIKDELAHSFDRFYSLADFDDQFDVVEDGQTYAENAMKKARKIGNRYGIDTLSDDSGLEVKALGDRPGIHSARYGMSDAARIDRLLGELAGVTEEARDAVFKAYLVYYMPAEGKGYIFYGHLKGRILTERRGSQGFGFDPVFYVSELGRTLAELTVEDKNRISHRGRALASFRTFLRSAAR